MNTHSEILTRWEPIPNLPSKLYLSSLLDDKQGLHLELVGESDIPMLVVKFDTFLSYRNADEGDRLKFLNEVIGQSNWSLYTVEDSKYLTWFHKQSYEIHQIENIQHYLFFTPNDIIDILSYEKPHVVFK